MHKKPLQPVAFTLTSAVPAALPLAQLPFPQAWHAPLKRLQEERSARLGQPVTIPYRSLNAALRIFVPHLLAAPQYVAEPSLAGHASASRPQSRNDGLQTLPWLIAQEPIRTGAIWLVMKAWAERMYRECESFSEILPLLREDDLQWARVELPFRGRVAPNNTANPDRLAYSALPTVLANLLVTRGTQLEVHGELRRLYRVPAREGAELMTWPPAYYRDKDKMLWPYSYVVHISLQTLAGCPEPRIHFGYSIRRWVSHPLMGEDALFLKRGYTSAYVRSSHAWLDLPATDQFTLARLHAVYTDDGRREPAWDDLVPEIAQRLALPFPSAEDLVRVPSRWLEGVNGMDIGIIARSTKFHPVEGGLGLDSYESITTTLAKGLAPELLQCPPLKALRPVAQPMKHRMQRPLRDLSKDERLAALVSSVGPNVTVEVYWQTPEIRDWMVDRVVAVLTKPRPPLVPDDALADTAADADGDEALPEEASTSADPAECSTADEYDEHGSLSTAAGNAPTQHPKRSQRRKRTEEQLTGAAPEELTVVLPGGRLRIVTRQWVFASPLDPPRSARRPSATNRSIPGEPTHPASSKTFVELSEERATAIARALDSVGEPTLAIVELPNYQDPSKPELRRLYRRRDPYLAIRKGMAATGRLVHFIASDLKHVRARAESVARDGLRQLGYLTAPLAIATHRGPLVPEDMIVAGMHLVRLTWKRALSRVYLPVVVCMHAQRQEVLAWLPDGKGLRSYRQALLDLALLSVEHVRRTKREQALTSLQAFLLRELASRTPNLTILCEAQNVRDFLPGVNNTQIAWDGVRFERDGRIQPVRGGQGAHLRFIRLRTADRGETPEWYVKDAAPDASVQGVWPDPAAPRLFYNVASKPHTAPRGATSKEIDPTTYYANASMLEVVLVAVQADSEPESWALAVDQWRRMSILTNGDMTLLPLPLALAQKMDEYAALIGAAIYPEEWESEDDDDDDDTIETGLRQLVPRPV